MSPAAIRRTMQLGYLVLRVPDVGSWQRFGTDVLGLQGAEADGRGDGTVRLRMDERAWRVGLQPGGDPGAVAIGYEVADEDSLASLRDDLARAGVDVRDDPALAEQRQVGSLLRLTDPAGFPLELFCSPVVDSTPFRSPTGARFVTGALGMGHVPLLVTDPDPVVRFYVDALGFRVTDSMVSGDIGSIFLRCNRRHHSTGVAWMPGRGNELAHLMMQVDDLDMVGRALDNLGRCREPGVQQVLSLGRHVNDKMVSFYCSSPSGLMVEYGCGAPPIDEEGWTTARYSVGSAWGHTPVGSFPDAGVAVPA